MASCNICLEAFKQPVSLPCGHIFCTECVVKTVQAVRPVRNVQQCPMCRAPYNVVPLNPLVIPPHLRPFITPTIRRVYINSPENPGESSSASIPPSVAEELAKLRNETQALRSHCVLWRRRAELHGAATLGLLDFARMVRDQAASLARERDQFRQECHSLKRKLDEYERLSQHDFNFVVEQPARLSCQPQDEYLTSTSPLSSPTYPYSTSLPSTSGSSQLGMPSLFDLHAYMNEPNAVPPSIPALPQDLACDLCPPQSTNMPGPSRSFEDPAIPSSSSTPTSPPLTTSPSAGSLSGSMMSTTPSGPQPTLLDQPNPKKRLRRDSVESAAVEVASPGSDRRQRKRMNLGAERQLALEALAQASQQRVVRGGAAVVAGSSSRS